MSEHQETDIIAVKKELEDCYNSMHAAISAANIYYFEYFPEDDYALQYHGKEKFLLDDRLENYPESWFAKNITHPDDAELLRNAFARVKKGEATASCIVRNYVDDGYRWHSYHFTSIYDAEGNRQKVVCTAQDITESKELEKVNNDFRNMYTRISGWVFTCKNDAGWTLKRSSPGIEAVTGYTSKEYAIQQGNEIAPLFPPYYRTMLQKEAVRMAQEGYGSRASAEVPVRHRNGSYHWMKIDLYWDKTDGEGLLYCSCSDITQLKKSQEELHERNIMYELTTKHAHINLWMYDIVNDVMHNTESSQLVHIGDTIIPDFVNVTLTKGIIRQDSREDFAQLYEQLRQGVESLTADIWLKTANGTGWWCERITYVTIFDDEHHPIKAFGLGRDVTEFKQAEQRIEAAKEFQDGTDSEKLLLKTRCNITANRVETLHTKPEMHNENPADTFYGGVAQVAENAYSDADRHTVLQGLSLHTLQNAAKENGGQYSFDYQRKDRKGHPSWTRISVRVLSHPDTQDLIGFVNIYDINAERKQAKIINRIATVDYEVLALIYVKTNEMESIRCKNAEEGRRMDAFGSYSKGMRQYTVNRIVEEQQEAALLAFDIQQIRRALENNTTYELSFSVKGEPVTQKTWKFTYFDDNREMIIYTRTDITEIFKKQELQRETLKNALLQAEEASKAKTNFLSRMSHEIRTPMNAIIGMNALALQGLNQPEQVREYLSKVGISARFLLSLINDILDMSRIESGKVTLKNEKFALDSFVHNLNNIIYGQAAQKGIDYDCVISNYTADYYIGDSMKLQQVLVNLLGNSIKFTEADGKVQLLIRQERVEKDKAYMVFSVNDTGIGISPAMQQTIFEPFEQGNTTTTTPYKGTGLGLAIAKNFVTLMGGTISVNSIEGVGSEFIVRVPLTCCPDEHYLPLKLSCPLEQLKTLIVDDDVTICEHTATLLEEIGMKAEWVDSGFRAVERIRMKWERQDYFNIVLLDWKMPDMDGIETTRQIRKIVGPDVTIIVMTAYDWNEIELEARQAGVNMLVTKPLFKSSLISAFERIFQEKEEEKLQVQQYDFTGKNILLVEDHILNVEVAKKLLETKHANVAVAENGLRSIEMFMEAPENYYDVILMDIRMPVMDGLTATKSIRQLRRPSAKTIPIIAMSANAFDEDIEKSKEAGMNEHLSKPIEPQTLFAVLNKWFQQE